MRVKTRLASTAITSTMDAPTTPAAQANQNVTMGMPARRYSRRRLATASAPSTKCSVTMPATHCSGQPVRSTTACRNTGGP
ncbi:Uncharacterised protein [Bordetella pertussis]|nr:Uncharacterised protein [Bordetella pertussis]